MFHRVYFETVKDDGNHIGSGWRIVFATIGRKWATVWCPYTLANIKIEIPEWERLARAGRPIDRFKLRTVDETAALYRGKASKDAQAALKAMRAFLRTQRANRRAQ